MYFNNRSFVRFTGVTTHCGCIFTARQRALASSFSRFLDHTQRRSNSRQDSSGRVISSSQRPLPDNAQHSQQTNIHAPSGIRTHNLSRRAAEVLCLRPHGHWDRCILTIRHFNYAYKNEQNIHWHIGLYTFVVTTP